MNSAGRDGLPVRGGSDLNRGVPGGGCSVTQLSVGIQAPGPERAIRFDGRGVVVSSGDNFPVRIRADLHRGVAAGIRSVPHLAELVASPSPERAVCFQRHRMIQAGRNRVHLDNRR